MSLLNASLSQPLRLISNQCYHCYFSTFRSSKVALFDVFAVVPTKVSFLLMAPFGFDSFSSQSNYHLLCFDSKKRNTKFTTTTSKILCTFSSYNNRIKSFSNFLLQQYRRQFYSQFRICNFSRQNRSCCKTLRTYTQPSLSNTFQSDQICLTGTHLVIIATTSHFYDQQPAIQPL